MAGAMCCMKPRLDSPEPPSRPHTSSIGDIFAKAVLPDDHPDCFHLPRVGIVDPSIIRSPKIADKLRMKFSRGSLKCSFLPSLFDDDARALAGQEMAGQLDGAHGIDCIEPREIDEARRVSETTCSDSESMTLPQIVWEKGLSPSQVERAEDFSISHTQSNATVSSENTRPSNFLATAALSEQHQMVRDLLPGIAGSSALSTSQSSLTRTLADTVPHEKQTSTSDPSHIPESPRWIEADIKTMSVASNIPPNHILQDSTNEAMSVKKPGSSVDKEPHEATRANAIPNRDVVPCACVTTVTPQDACAESAENIAQGSTGSPCPRLQEMDISNKLRSVSHVSLPLTSDQTLVSCIPTPSVHYLDGSAERLISKHCMRHTDGFPQQPNGTRADGNQSSRASARDLILDASSSVYSRSCSTDNNCGRMSPCDIVQALNADLMAWPLRTNGAIQEPQEHTKAMCEQAPHTPHAPECDVGHHEGIELVRSRGTDLTNKFMEPLGHSPASELSVKVQSTTSESSLGALSKSSRKSRFVEAFTPPKRTVRKRRSFFRFLRPGSRRQARSFSMPMLRRTSPAPNEFMDGTADDVLTVEYDMSNDLSSEECHVRSMTDRGPRGSMSLTTEGTSGGQDIETTASTLHSTALEYTAGCGSFNLLAVPKMRRNESVEREDDVSRSDTNLRHSSVFHQHAESGAIDAKSSCNLALSKLGPEEPASCESSFNLRAQIPLTAGRERRPTLADYERGLSITGDDRRRPSSVNISEAYNIDAEDRKESISVRRKLHRARALEHEDGDANPLMANALRRHQQEKAMFRSESKRRESMLPSQSVNLFDIASPFGQSGGTQGPTVWEENAPDELSPVADAPDVPTRSLEIAFPAIRRPSQRLRRGADAQDPSTVHTSVAQTPTNPLNSPILLPYDTPSHAKKGNSFPSWSRFASHTRVERCGSAGTADSVLARDFASGCNDCASLSPRTQQDFTSGNLAAIERGKKGRTRPLAKSRSMTFGSIVRYYHTLFTTSGSDFLGKNRRTSVAVGGKLKHPELEMLPPTLAVEHHPSSFHRHLKQIEERVMDDIDEVLHHSPHVTHPCEKQENAASVPTGIEFRLDCSFVPHHHIVREDSIGEPAERSPREQSPIEQSSDEQDPVEDILTNTGLLNATSGASPTMGHDGSTSTSPVIPALDGTYESGQSKFQYNKEKASSSHADTWSQVYKHCVSRQVPRLSVSEEFVSSRGSIDPFVTLKPAKARSPIQNEKLDPNVRIRRFPSVTVVDDRKGHLRSISLISAQSLNSSRNAGSAHGIQRTSTYDLISFLQAKEQEEKDKLLGVGLNVSAATGVAV